MNKETFHRWFSSRNELFCSLMRIIRTRNTKYEIRIRVCSTWWKKCVFIVQLASAWAGFKSIKPRILVSTNHDHTYAMKKIEYDIPLQHRNVNGESIYTIKLFTQQWSINMYEHLNECNYNSTTRYRLL